MSRLYYDVSAVKWNEALLLCNGSLGAMVFVGVMLKRIQRLFPFAQFIIVTTSKFLAFSPANLITNIVLCQMRTKFPCSPCNAGRSVLHYHYRQKTPSILDEHIL